MRAAAPAAPPPRAPATGGRARKYYTAGNRSAHSRLTGKLWISPSRRYFKWRLLGRGYSEAMAMDSHDIP